MADTDPQKKSPRDIVKAAAEYFTSVTDNVDITQLRLEEIIQDDENNWHVTLSYPTRDLDSIFGGLSREYKEFLIDEGGSVRSMKIKKL